MLTNGVMLDSSIFDYLQSVTMLIQQKNLLSQESKCLRSNTTRMNRTKYYGVI